MPSGAAREYGWRGGRAGIIEEGGVVLGFMQALVDEGILVMAAGLTFFGGIRGIIFSALLLSLLNALQPGNGFWPREGIVLLAAVCFAFLLVLVNRKAGASGVVNGVVGSFISLIVFAVFATPILALVVWLLVVGTGLIPHVHRKQVYWGIAPTLLRILMGLGWIVLGNLVVF